MRYRVMDILLVCSPYDNFILEEAGQINERVYGEFRNLDLHYSPGLTRVSSGREALSRLAERRFDLVVTVPQVADMDAAQLAKAIRDQGFLVPVVLLGYDHRGLKDFAARHDTTLIDRAFLWQGDARILLAIVKYIEDKLNVAHDAAAVGVQVIILIEDSVRYYSSFLPEIYSEILQQSQRLISEGVNLSHKIMRMRARPKILLCSNYEDASAAFSKYESEVLGVISDIEFPRGGERDAASGADFAHLVREKVSDVPVILQSSNPSNETRATKCGAEFLLKGSPLLLHDLRAIMLESFGFGDFVFRMPDRTEVDRAEDLRALERKLRTVPVESLVYHAERNHISRWLKARTEFGLAEELRPGAPADFPNVEDLRTSIVHAIAGYRVERTLAQVADFDRESFNPADDFHRIGGGSLGGKARGLAFGRLLIGLGRLRHRFEGVRVAVPAAAVVGTDAFDEFVDGNGLRDFALQCDDDGEIRRRFMAARLSGEIRRDLAVYLEQISYPLAIRSSSLLEDSQYLPFTGVYETFMLPNNHPDPEVRLRQVIRAIKEVYASTYLRAAKRYTGATPYRQEEEKMAVIVQRLVGSRHGNRFYPSFAGVARSHNVYPTPPLESEDGIAAVGLGFGKAVVDGENCLRFSPRHPKHILQFSAVGEALKYSQRSFWALELPDATDRTLGRMREARFDLGVAEADGTLAPLASTYSLENNAIYDGVSRAGTRVVTFAPVLKHEEFPLADILDELLRLGREGMTGPVEVEFAVELHPEGRDKREFGFLQVRPLALDREVEPIHLPDVERDSLLCHSDAVLGHGTIEDIHDVVVVDAERFERSRSRETAAYIGRLNAELSESATPYLLIGVGRWGSADPWLGIPVSWDQISGARAIVEAGLRDYRVSPSQGTHFFQNLTSFNIGYFTVNPEVGEGWVDWEWLAARPAMQESAGVRHLRFDEPLLIQMSGRQNSGLVLKPGASVPTDQEVAAEVV